jgi:predicted amidohydrolase
MSLQEQTASRFVAAVIQLNSTSDESLNLRVVEDLVSAAVDRGARFVATPENTNFLGPHGEKAARAQTLAGPVCGLFSSLARRHRIHLLLGSFNERASTSDRCYNTSVLFDSAGEIVAVYRKIHLFDVDVPSVRFRESETVLPGDEVVVADTQLARFGLSICYDLRFGELYRELSRRGAEVLTVPSAFTATTGVDHWETLVRARAIENQCYVLAPAQWGRHDDRGLRESWGHAMISDPWGLVLGVCSDGPGVAVADIDLERVHSVRLSMPVGDHRRL